MQLVAPGIWRQVGVVEAEQCRELIALAEANGFRRAHLFERGRRNHETYLDCERVRAALRTTLGATPGRAAEFYRYDPGASIVRHWDAPTSLGGGRFSRWTFLLYLNDDFEGGETVFPELGYASRPRTGDALLFEHGLTHEASEVRRGRKYVMRTCTESLPPPSA